MYPFNRVNKNNIGFYTAIVFAPKKLLCQRPKSSIRTGTLRWKGSVRKYASIWWILSCMVRKSSAPRVIIVEMPISESVEYRAPTQSQNTIIFAVSMPNLTASPVLVETATKCRATCSGAPGELLSISWIKRPPAPVLTLNLPIIILPD